MKKTPVVIACIMAFIVLVSCPGCGNGDAEKAAIGMRDSLQTEMNSMRAELEDMSGLMSVVTTGLDSLAMQEGLLFINNDVEKKKLTRGEVRERVRQLKELLQRQRKTIALLTDSISARDNNTENVKRLTSIIEFLNQQLDAKDVELQRLQTELMTKSRSIEDLQGSLATMQTNVVQLEEQTEAMTTALAVQDEVLNEGFVKIGTSKELQQAGLLSGGGFLKKRKVDYSQLDAANFTKVDIRKATEIKIDGKKPKLLSAHPSGTYELKENEDKTWTLVVLDPTTFWKASNYLIIQVK